MISQGGFSGTAAAGSRELAKLAEAAIVMQDQSEISFELRTVVCSLCVAFSAETLPQTIN